MKVEDANKELERMIHSANVKLSIMLVISIMLLPTLVAAILIW